jgi:hypothetical protein
MTERLHACPLQDGERAGPPLALAPTSSSSNESRVDSYEPFWYHHEQVLVRGAALQSGVPPRAGKVCMPSLRDPSPTYRSTSVTLRRYLAFQALVCPSFRPLRRVHPPPPQFSKARPRCSVPSWYVRGAAYQSLARIGSLSPNTECAYRSGLACPQGPTFIGRVALFQETSNA